MRSIAKVFGRSPFVPLQAHMEKVAECVQRLPGLFETYRTGDEEAIAAAAKEVSRLEYEADLIKHDIRSSLPRGLFLPVHRSNLLGVLSLQDSLADGAENISVLLTFKQAAEVGRFRELFDEFLAKCLETFDAAREIIGELDELLETGFGGQEADKVKARVDEVSLREHEADVLSREVVRELLRHEDELSYGDFFLWQRILRQLSKLSDRADNLAAAIGSMLDK
jgi:predicted phosphate transport protein (TIGR00153 family)